MTDSKTFILSECPAPYPPWVAGARLPEITFTIPLKAGEDFSSVIVTGFLSRDLSDPLAPDVLEKTASLIEHVAGEFVHLKFSWAAGDLIAGLGQIFLVKMFPAGDTIGQLLARFQIDVIADPDPTP